MVCKLRFLLHVKSSQGRGSKRTVGSESTNHKTKKQKNEKAKEKAKDEKAKEKKINKKTVDKFIRATSIMISGNIRRENAWA